MQCRYGTPQWDGAVGTEVHPLFPQMFESHRVKFYMQTEVSELREQEGKVRCGSG